MATYLIIILIQVMGIGFNAWQKVLVLDKLYPDDSLHDVFKLFWKADRITVFISGWILLAYLLLYYIAVNYAPKDSPVNTSAYFTVGVFVLSLVLGYGGQGIVYKALGKAVDAANKKIDNTK